MAESMSYAPEAQKNELLKQSIDPKSMDKLMSGINKANKLQEQALSSQQADREIALATEKNAFAEAFPGVAETTSSTPDSTSHILATGKTPEISNNITKTLESGKSNVDIKEEVRKIFDNLGETFPFLKKLIDLFKNITGTGDTDKKVTELEKIKEEEQLKILEKYGVKVETPANGINTLTFNKDAKIQGEKTMKPTEPIDTTKTPEKTPIKLKNDNTLIIDFKNATSADIKDNDNGFTLTVKNKDGSTDTYKVESPKAPTTSPETKPV